MKSYVRGRLSVACCNFLDHLKAIGIKASVGHFGRQSKGLFVLVRKPEDIEKIPKEFNGLKIAEVRLESSVKFHPSIG